jgi:methyl-accepting chemotaxis protein
MSSHLRALIVRPLREVQRMSQRLAAGDLQCRTEFEGKGEFRELMHTLNVMQGTLHTMVSDVVTKAGVVGEASAGIASGISSLSSRTEAQASSLEETASSMEELTSTVRENADNASQASQLMEETRASAQVGGAVVMRAVEAMSEIDSASKRIAEISTVIDEIAFQTNLLALNAAVEAARAGEQGRGFAVVAGEVRNLAQRSASSAREIKNLISDTVHKVENGRRLVNESGQTLNDIVNRVSKVNTAISDIAGASREQAAGIDQVGNAVMQLDHITQQNARLVDDSARASKLLASESEALVDIVGFFRSADPRREAVRAPVSNHSDNAAASPVRSVVRKPRRVA